MLIPLPNLVPQCVERPKNCQRCGAERFELTQKTIYPTYTRGKIILGNGATICGIQSGFLKPRSLHCDCTCDVYIYNDQDTLLQCISKTFLALPKTEKVLTRSEIKFEY